MAASYVNYHVRSDDQAAVTAAAKGLVQGRAYLTPPGNGWVSLYDEISERQDAYEIGPEKIIDTYAAATQHVDQGLSLTLFFKDTVTTRDINKAQIYAWRKGIKSLYYIRLRQLALEGTEVDGCVSCML